MTDLNVLCTLLCFTLAELIWRFGRAIIEYRYFFKHYDAPKFWTICVYSFTFSTPSLILLSCITLYAATEYGNMINVTTGMWKQKIIIIIYLLFRLVSFDKSTLYYSDMIRSDCGIDYATGMASNYFHGYLKLTLPSLHDQTGIRDRILDYEDKHNVEFAVKRLFILIPSSLHTKDIFLSDIMEKDDNPLEVKKSRAGVVNRRFTNAVYRITIDGKFYYICAEGATPLLSYLDSINSPITSTWQTRAMQKEITLKFYSYLKKILSQYNETVKQVEIVYYNDKSPEGELIDVGEILATYIKSLWKKEKKGNEKEIGTENPLW